MHISSTQVQIHTNLEKKLPSRLMKRWTKNEVVFYVNKGPCSRASTIWNQVSQYITCNQSMSLWCQWIVKPVNTEDVMESKEDGGTESVLFMELFKQKQRSDSRSSGWDPIFILVFSDRKTSNVSWKRSPISSDWLYKRWRFALKWKGMMRHKGARMRI